MSHVTCHMSHVTCHMSPFQNIFHLSVCVVCLSVCVFTFEVLFKSLFDQLPEVGCPKFLEIRNSWGKEMQRSGLTFENYY